ncbi:hypothetical protein ILYODFUR_025364 [Ilyodon furcidens]|uniref:Uncharacterized protein n=1 Tax=Ilyodon furcidens TaxID=33524 RepID=A0ABV0VIH3_9TELE
MMMTMIMRPNTSPQSSHTRAMRPTSCQPVLEQTESFVVEAPPKKRKTSSKVRRRRSNDEKSTVLRGKDEADSDADNIKFAPAREPGPIVDRNGLHSPFSSFFST